MHKPSPEVYVDNIDPIRAVEEGISKALNENKRLAIVLGAQWCHDSRGFAATLIKPEMQKLIDESYEVIYLNVGYYRDLRAVTKRFGQAIYYATPTVMIVDPATETLLNGTDMHIWGNADSLPFSAYVDNFTKYSKQDALDIALKQKDMMDEQTKKRIDDFESFQAQRLYEAYQILVPGMIKEDTTKQPNDEFIAKWIEVRNFRMNLQTDIQALREKALSNPNSDIELPVYQPFSWQ